MPGITRNVKIVSSLAAGLTVACVAYLNNQISHELEQEIKMQIEVAQPQDQLKDTIEKKRRPIDVHVVEDAVSVKDVVMRRDKKVRKKEVQVIQEAPLHDVILIQ
ncbi:MAG: hypothetical protein KAJ18_06225 [Candidatus Omnitrophica bacterium]|nr:hypothetical protein [Candidatus Omnitrophota bacterium]